MKQPPPTIKRVITAVYCLLNAKNVTGPKFNVEWAGGPYSCQVRQRHKRRDHFRCFCHFPDFIPTYAD